MWKGAYRDAGDELLDKLVEQTLQGEVIPFDKWIDAMEELEEIDGSIPEPTEEEIQCAAAARKDFLERMDKFGLSLDDRYRLCEDLYIKAAEENPGPELLRLYCDIVCDQGLFLDADRENRSPEQDALNWRRQSADATELYRLLGNKKQLSVRFRKILNRAKKATKTNHTVCVDCVKEADDVIHTFSAVFPIKGKETEMRDNLAVLLQTAHDNDALTALIPLFLYRVLTRHMTRLQKDNAPHLNFEALWNWQNYQIEKDNGKNYKTNVSYLLLFEGLYKMYADAPGVDASLCLYGFDHLSNLGEFYTLFPEEHQPLPFQIRVEEIFFHNPFSCYENGYKKNVVLEHSGLSVKALEAFLSDSRRCRESALNRISGYMNRDLVGLTRRFIEGGPTMAKELCMEILCGANLPKSQRPKDEEESNLFLAAIHTALMECVDDWATDYLVRAGKLLCGDDVLQKEDAT